MFLTVAEFVLLMIAGIGCASVELDIENGLDDFDEVLGVGRYQVAIFNYKQVSPAFTVTLWIILGVLAKIGYLFSLLFYFI